MKAFLISDTHLGVHPIKLDYWLYDVVKDYFDNFFFPTLEKYKQEGDIIIHMGDFFDDRSILPVNVIDYGIKLVEKMSKIMPVHMILGNHDIYTEYDNSVHSMKWAKHIKNVTLYENPKVISFGTKTALMMPWMQYKKDEVDLLNKTNADYVFCHSDLKGAYNNKKVKMRHGMDIKSFKKFKQVWSGHIHLRQKTYNFQFVGSPYHLTRHDIDDQKGIYILDIDTGKYKFIPNTISPEYKTIEIIKESDIVKLDEKNFNNDRIDLKISNKLLIESKQIRSKIEELLQNNKFEKIEWQDEIILEDVVDENDIDFVEGDLDYNIKKLTYEYVYKQNFEDNNNIKDSIISILDQMFEIYESNL